MERELKMPRVSVILPVHNGMPYLPRAVESILGQTFQDWELIVIDDASTDTTAEYLAGLTDRRVRVIRNQQNLGVARTLNKALPLAAGKYIARQDADDVSLPQRLEKQVSFLDQHRDVALLGTNWSMIDEKGSVILRSTQVPNSDIDIKWGLLFHCCIVHPSVMLRPEVLAVVGCYPEATEFCYAEDYELWCRIAKNHRTAALPEALVHWRLNSACVTIRHDRAQLEQVAQISHAYVRWIMGANPVDRQGCEAVRVLFRSRAGTDPQLPPARLRAGVAFLDALQAAFYGKHGFTPAEIGAHRRHWYWIWGKHLLALSLRTRAGMATRAMLFALGTRYMLRIPAAALPIGVLHPPARAKESAQATAPSAMSPPL